MKKKHRIDWAIIFRILHILVGNGSESGWWKLQSAASLNSRLYKRYISILMKFKMVTVKVISPKHQIVRITSKGFDFIERWDAACEILGIVPFDTDIFLDEKDDQILFQTNV
jgi:predicted transcriptional regulator